MEPRKVATNAVKESPYEIRTGEFKSLRDEPGGCPPVGQAVSGV
jgi:hypothetical protein